jgi:hypothetical protein
MEILLGTVYLYPTASVPPFPVRNAAIAFTKQFMSRVVGSIKRLNDDTVDFLIAKVLCSLYNLI